MNPTPLATRKGWQTKTQQRLARILVADVDRLQSQRRRGVGNLLAVLVAAGLEEHPFAGHALVPRQHVRRDRLVRVPDVWVPWSRSVFFLFW